MDKDSEITSEGPMVVVHSSYVLLIAILLALACKVAWPSVATFPTSGAFDGGTVVHLHAIGMACAVALMWPIRRLWCKAVEVHRA
jgi:hypothetical protein